MLRYLIIFQRTVIPMNKNEELLFLLRRAAALTRRKSGGDGSRKDQSDPPKKGAGHGHILSTVAENDGKSQQELAALLGIRPQSLSEALTSLEERGYISRRQGEGDRRRTLVFITESGREKNRELSGIRNIRAEKLFASLTEEEKDTLIGLLSRLPDMTE